MARKARTVTENTATEETATEETATEETATEETTTEETATEETTEGGAGETETATESKPQKRQAQETDFAKDDKNRGEFLHYITALTGTPAEMVFGAEPFRIGVTRLSAGAYVAQFESKRGNTRSLVKTSAESAIRDALTGAQFPAKQWALGDVHATEIAEIGAVVKVATKTEKTVDFFEVTSDGSNGEAVAMATDIAEKLALAESELQEGEGKTLSGWFNAGEALVAIDGMFAQFAPDLDPKSKAYADMRGRWFNRYVVSAHPDIAKRLTSRNTVNQLRMMSAYSVETARALGVNTPSMFEQKGHGILRHYAEVIADRMFAAWCKDNGETLSADALKAFTTSWDGRAVEFDAEVLRQVGLSKEYHDTALEAWQKDAMKAIEAGGVPLPKAAGLAEEQAMMPFLLETAARKLSRLTGAIVKFVADKLAKEVAKENKDTSGGEGGEGGEGSEGAGNAFAALSIDAAAAHLFAMLRAHPDAVAVLDVLAGLVADIPADSEGEGEDA